MYSNYYSVIAWLWAILGVFAIFAGIIVFSVLVVYLVGLWKLFQKAGKNGWEAIIPFYNTWVLVKISGLAWWYFLIIISTTLADILDIHGIHTVCQIISLVGTFFCYYNISKKLHKEVGFAILMTLFPVIMIPIVGLSNHYQIDESVSVSENGPIDGESQQSQTRNNQNEKNTETNKDSKVSGEVKHKYCTFCGKEIKVGAKYCGNCGKEIK